MDNKGIQILITTHTRTGNKGPVQMWSMTLPLVPVEVCVGSRRQAGKTQRDISIVSSGARHFHGDNYTHCHSHTKYCFTHFAQ